MVNKHKQKKKIYFRKYGSNKKELNALDEKQIVSSLKTRKGENRKRAAALTRNADF